MAPFASPAAPPFDATRTGRAADVPGRPDPDHAVMARHRLLVTIAATALGVGCVAARDLGPGSATTTISAPPATTAAAARGLDPGLVRAFDAAAAAAAADGHRLTITSGFRTTAEQQALLDAEIAKRGSIEEALRWVFTPERSMHVRGLAVDVGDGPAADWLAAEGAGFGLCRTMGWEWWHFEWRVAWAQERWCPGPVDDPADAPT